MDRDGGDAGADVGAAPKPRYKTVAELEMELLLGTGDAKGKGETRAREPAPISDSDSDEIAVIGKRGKRITPGSKSKPRPPPPPSSDAKRPKLGRDDDADERHPGAKMTPATLSESPAAAVAATQRGARKGTPCTAPRSLHSIHCPGIGRCDSQIDRGRRMTVNATLRSCAR